MKNIVFADVHLGQLSDSYVEENGLERSVNETIKQLNNILKHAIKNEIKRMFITGDIFENQNPIARYNKMFNMWLKRAYKAKIEVIIIPGNHDGNNSGESAICPIKEANFPNVKVFEEITSEIINDINYIFVPHLTKNQMGIDNIKDFEKESKKIIKKRIVKNIIKGKKNIIMTHIHASGAVVGSEEKRLKGGINLFPAITSEDITVIYSGHLHKHQKLEVGGIPFYYPGSIIRNDFSETKEDKGFIVFDDKNPEEIEFVKLNTTEYKEIKLNLKKSGILNLNEEKVKKAVQGKVVKIVIDVNEDDKKGINLEEIMSVFGKYCFVAKKEVNVIKKDKKVAEIKSYDPLIIFKDYVKKNIKDKDQNIYIKNTGLEILKEVM